MYWWRAWAVAMIAVASHLLLDLTNVYGVRLLLPFSGRWFHWDNAAAFTDVYVFVLLIVVLLVKPSGLFGSTVREKV